LSKHLDTRLRGYDGKRLLAVLSIWSLASLSYSSVCNPVFSVLFVIPDFCYVIPVFSFVIPAQAGIQNPFL
jgi:hypothetical protein